MKLAGFTESKTPKSPESSPCHLCPLARCPALLHKLRGFLQLDQRLVCLCGMDSLLRFLQAQARQAWGKEPSNSVGRVYARVRDPRRRTRRKNLHFSTGTCDL